MKDERMDKKIVKRKYKKKSKPASIYFLLWASFCVLSLIIILVFSFTQSIALDQTYREEGAKEITIKGQNIEQILKESPPEQFGGNHSGFVRYLAQSNGVDIYIISEDGLRLHGTFFPLEGSKKTVICFHVYTSEGLNDYSTLALFYKAHGYNLLLVDERAHGKSEGVYIGFGCLDRKDALLWIQEVIRRQTEEVEILLHGDSMGGATVVMATGLTLPPQVKAAVSDCAFTSAWEVFDSVLKNSYHIPSFPVLHIANEMVKRKAGYSLDECNGVREVARAEIPILFIHGKEDTFVPCSMAYELYNACNSDKKLVIVEGAGHVESCYKDEALFQNAIEEFIFPYFEH